MSKKKTKIDWRVVGQIVAAALICTATYFHYAPKDPVQTAPVTCPMPVPYTLPGA